MTELRLAGGFYDSGCAFNPGSSKTLFKFLIEKGFQVLAGATDKPHGLREAYIEGPDGYVWVADVPL